MKIIIFLMELVMLPVDLIFLIFGDDPDRPMFYVGLPFVGLYLFFVACAMTALISFMVMAEVHMLGTILVWIGFLT